MTRLSVLAGIPVLALALLFAGLASCAVAYAAEAAVKKSEESASKNEKNAQQMVVIGQSFSATFYLLAMILMLLVSIRLFRWKQKMKLPRSPIPPN